MKTTLNLDDELLRRAKVHAAGTGTTLTSVVEAALQAALMAPEPAPPFRLDFPVVSGTSPPAVDPADRVALYDLIDEPE